MSRHDHHGEKELAAFIRAGAERRPEQAYGDYFKGKYASCALGAAYEGMYRLARVGQREGECLYGRNAVAGSTQSPGG